MASSVGTTAKVCEWSRDQFCTSDDSGCPICGLLVSLHAPSLPLLQVVQNPPYADVAEGFHGAIGSGDLEKIRRLIGECPSLLSGTYNRWFPIHRAVANGRLNVVHALVDEYKCDVNKVDLDNKVPLFQLFVDGRKFSTNSRLVIAKFLVLRGAILSANDIIAALQVGATECADFLWQKSGLTMLQLFEWMDTEAIRFKNQGFAMLARCPAEVHLFNSGDLWFHVQSVQHMEWLLQNKVQCPLDHRDARGRNVFSRWLSSAPEILNFMSGSLLRRICQ